MPYGHIIEDWKEKSIWNMGSVPSEYAKENWGEG